MTLEIVKVQLPLFSTDPDPLPLVYAENNRHCQNQRIPGRIYRDLRRSKKGYYEAEYIGGFWEIGKRVEDQSW